MGQGIRFGEKLQVVPLFAPAVSTADTVETAFVALENVQWLTFIIMLGVMTSDSTDLLTVSVVTSTGQTTATGDTAIPFKYRISSAVATDAWGAITAGTTAGLALTAEQDAMAVQIEVDPTSIPALDTDALYCYLDFGTPTIVTGYASVLAVIEPRFPQNANLTSS